MNRQTRVTDKWIELLLANPIKIERELELFLITDDDNDYENLNVVVSKTGRETENRILNKITDKDYVFKRECLKCVEKLFSEMEFFVKEIVIMKYRKRYSIDRICYEVNYSKTSVYDFINKEKNKLKDMILKVECKVYNFE